MKRTLAYLLAFVPLLVLVVPGVASAAIWDPVIDGRCVCPGSAPDWGCVIQTIQNVMNLAVSLAVVIATLVIAYAGAIWLVSPVNPKSREMGRTMLLNAVIGLVVLLAGWIFVDFLMKQLYNENANSNGVTLGPWNEILKPSATGDDMCITRRTEFGAEGTPSTGTGTVTTPTDGGDDDDTPTPAGPGLPFSLSGINSQQRNHVSTQLREMLNCMADKSGTDGAVITSISDDYLFQGKTWEQCRGGQCQHCGTGAGNVCPAGGASYHYGGTGCGNSSYAVDFSADTGTAQSNALIQAAQQCGGRSVSEGGNHTHIQIGSCN